MRQVYILLLSLLVVSCSSVPKAYLETNDLCGYKDSIFNTSKVKKKLSLSLLFNSLERQKKVIRNDSLYNICYIVWEDYITYKETNKRTGISKWIDYNRKGLIISSGFIYLNGKSYIFKETYYDKEGNVEKIIDHDKGYKVCWAEAIAIVKKIAKHKIKKYEITSFYLYKVDLNEFPQAKPMWFVGLSDGNEKLLKEKFKNGSIRYVIDGVTGKFIGINRVIMKYD